MAEEITSSNTSTTDLLRDAQYAKTIELLPLIIVLTLSGAIGIVGNIITIRFYTSKRRKTATIVLIISLAIVDLIVCLLFVTNIVEMLVNIKYTSRVACKITHFVGHWFLASSGLILGFIAIDRYRRICAASKKKMTKMFTKRVVVVILVFSCIMSVRDFANFDITTVTISTSYNSNLTSGHVCSTSKDPKLKLSVSVFHILDATLASSVLLMIIFSYSNIIWKVCKLGDRKPIKPDTSNHTGVKTAGQNNAATCCVPTSHGRIDPDQSEQGISPRGAMSCLNASMENGAIIKQNNKRRKIRRSEWNITLLMFAVSVACVLCVAPYFIVKIGLISVKRASDLELGLLTQFGLRLVYISSVLNPLIYCLFNPAFRRHVRKLLSCKEDNVESVYRITSGALDMSTTYRSRHSE